jgi:hypothetical protein
MKNYLPVIVLWLLACLHATAQKTALEYLAEVSFEPKVDICTCSPAEFKNYIYKTLGAHANLLEQDINRRQEIAINNELAGNVEFRELLEKTIAVGEKQAMRLYNLQLPSSGAEGDLLQQQAVMMLNTRADVMNKMTNKEVDEDFEKAYQAFGIDKNNPKPASKEEANNLAIKMCHERFPKYKAALDSCAMETRESLPLYRRLGEVMYSGPDEVKELPALNSVLVLIKSYQTYMHEVSGRE